jgi:thiamine monophosphate kinase
MDISDGLIQDAKKMAKASNVCFEIDYNLLKFAKNEGQENGMFSEMLADMLSFGDDYNILISSTVPVQNATQIGVVKQGRGLNLLNFPFEILNAGYDHFA